MPHSTLNSFRGVEGQQVQNRVQSPQRQMADTLVVQSLAVFLCCAVYLVVQWCLTLSDPMDYTSPGSSVHGILQAGILAWVAFLFAQGSG